MCMLSHHLLLKKCNKDNTDKIEKKIEFSLYIFYTKMHTFSYSYQNPKMFDFMFEHLQQFTHLFLLEIGGASTSCNYA